MYLCLIEGAKMGGLGELFKSTKWVECRGNEQAVRMKFSGRLQYQGFPAFCHSWAY